MIKAIVSKTKDAFTGITVEGTDAYQRNILRDQDFIIPVLLPQGMDPEDALYLLEEGKRRILKTAVEMYVRDEDGNEVKVKHYKLSKG